MKPAPIIIAALLIAQPAQACHRYSRWYFPYPQHCRVVTAYAPLKPMAHAVLHHFVAEPTRDIDIPLPDMNATWEPALDTPEELELIQGMQRLKALRLLSNGE